MDLWMDENEIMKPLNTRFTNGIIYTIEKNNSDLLLMLLNFVINSLN